MPLKDGSKRSKWFLMLLGVGVFAIPIGIALAAAVEAGVFAWVYCFVWMVTPLAIALAIRVLLWRWWTPRATPRDPDACWNCGYDIRGLPGTTCPECGEFNDR